MSIETHPRTKIEIIVDHPHLPDVTAILEGRAVRGYSVFESLSGKGSRGAWVQAHLTDADDRLLIVVVTSSETADLVLGDLDELFEEIPGVVFVSDVRVLRTDRF